MANAQNQDTPQVETPKTEGVVVEQKGVHNSYFFPHLLKSVEARTLEEAMELIKKLENKEGK